MMDKDSLSFFLCGRGAGTAAVTFSILASSIGGTATIAMLALAGKVGWPAFWWLGSGAIGLGVLGLAFAKKIRASRAATLPEILGIHMGDKCRLLASVIILLSSIAIVAAQFNAIGVILSVFIDLDFNWSVIGGSAVIWLYTCWGGQKAVIKSDIWQFVILAVALLCAFLCLLDLPPCRRILLTTPLQFANPELPLLRVIYFIAIFGASFTIGPMIFGRLLSSKSPRCARKASLAAAFGMALMACLIAAMGIAISALSPGQGSPEQILLATCKIALPQWLTLLLLAGLLAAVLSSADSCLLTAAIVCSRDLRMGGTVLATRLAMTWISALSCMIVFGGRGILGLLLAASDIYTCGIVPPTIVALLRTKNLNSTVFLYAMIAGGSLGLIAALSGNYLWSFAGLLLSASLSILGCRITSN